VVALEGPAECLLGVVAHPAADRRHAEVGAPQQLAGQVHAPLGEVPDGRSPEHPAEPLVEHRARHWFQSYVTDDAIVCVYVAEDAEAVAEHARLGGFPCAGLRQVRTVIDPVTAEG
jgi:hypothetical protein